MGDAKRSNFPSMTAAHWWALRKRFQRTVPATVTNEYISSVLGNMTPESARANVLRPIRAVGLIDEAGKPTDLAGKWRDDEQYAATCDEIRKGVYPQELLDTFPNGDAGFEAVQKWFARQSNVGQSAAGKMARFYLLLAEADPNKGTEAAAAVRTAGAKATTPKKAPAVSRAAAATTEQRTDNASSKVDSGDIKHPARASNSGGLSLHIDVQIHISPEASLDQIDQIFASMAKHLPFGKQEGE